MTDAHFYMLMTGLLACILIVQTADLAITVRHVLSARKNGGKR